MTTKTKTKGPSYPFLSKAQILATQADFATCLEHLAILVGRQTEDEVATATTKWKNRSGLMSSHAVNGTRLQKKVEAGEALDDEDVAKVRGIVCRYGKQLAAYYRAREIDKNPELAAVAAIFSAN